jgi:hypothetical protein
MIRRVFITGGMFVLLAGLAFAQRGGGGGGGRGGGRGGDSGGGMPGGGGGRAQAADKLATLTQELKLTAPEQTALQGVFDDAQKQTAPLLQQATDEQQAMLRAAMNGQDTAGSVQKLAGFRAQMKMVEVEAFKQALSKLDDSQKKKASKLYELMNGIFMVKDWRRAS